MFCPNCGSENEANARVCSKCGTPLGVEVSPVKKPTMSKKTMGILAGGAIVVVVLLFMLINSMNTINLNKYLIFEQSGVNGYGKVSIYFDDEKFVEDNGSKFKLSKAGKKQLSKDLGFDTKELAEYLEDYTGDYIADSFILYGVDVDYDHSASFSNGDTVEYTIELDEDELKYLDCKIKYKGGTYKFKDLEEVKTMDYFENLEVSFDGISPNGGSIHFDTSNIPSELSKISYTIENAEYNRMSNGDVFTVVLDDISIQNNVEKNGYAPSEKTKEFTVSGLKELVTEVGQLNDDAINYMIGEAEDYMTAYAAKRWNDETEELVSLEHTGTWVLSPKKGTSNNFVFLTFDLTIHMNDESFDFDKTETFTWYVGFSDVFIADNEVNFDSSNLKAADYYGDRVEYCKDGSDSCWYDRFYYYGYKNNDAFVKNRINSMVDNYVVDGGLID